ncbi:MAG: hypothetical protein JF599_02500 [Verrucomicrobia bacterium]|nr:hypothetical protein [Verrucomicrobiota bacterium]
MHSCDPIAWLELPVIQKIIDDEKWLEGERRGCAIGDHDPVVTERVCSVILRIGRQLRETLHTAQAA